jgi:3-oxoacyl-[acyl-carrier-protein] synthase-1
MLNNMKRRIAITGFGIVSSIGNNCKDVLDSLIKNKSGVVAVPEWEKLGLKSCVAGTIKDFSIKDIRKKIGLQSRYMDMSSLCATLSAKEAIEMSGLTQEDISSEKVSCIVGSGVSNTDPIARAALNLYSKNGRLTPYDVTRTMSSSCSANLVNIFGIKGRSYSISSACATSVHNIGHGCELIWGGISDIAIVGGADEVSDVMTAIFDAMRTAITRSFNATPQKASRPYDIKRDGFVISGGAGIVILEEFERARKRNARIYGEIIGYGASSDAHDIIQPHPKGDGACRCMIETIKNAGCSIEEIDYINTHGTSTPAGDLSEAHAIQRVFKDYKVPISSTKSLTGHGIGAAGVQELIYCLLMMENNFITASINIEELDPSFKDLNIVTKNRQENLNKVLTNSFGFGGTNAALVITKV